MRKKPYAAALAMAQSMFCALPTPFRVWKEEARPLMLLFLPLVGLEIGGIWAFCHWLLRLWDVPPMVYGLLMCALPYLACGFIHLDGFLDVADAICSWRELEKRREILKDSHVGAFAVIWCVFLILAGFALFSSAPADANGYCLLFVPPVSRCCSAIAVWSLPAIKTSQYAQNGAVPPWHRAALILLVCSFLTAGFFFFGKYGFVLLGTLAGYGLALFKSYRSLKGINGDVAGFCLTVAELCAAAVFALI